MGNLDQDQAAMYRWMRRRVGKDKHTFQSLTGRSDLEFLTELEIDDALRSAYERDYVANAIDGICLRSALRQGKLPPELGMALASYTEAVRDAASFKEDLGGVTYVDMDLEVKIQFVKLCNEIAKLR